MDRFLKRTGEEKGHKMNTQICPTCGCSLVRLGVGKDKAVAHHHRDKNYHFCCQGCVEVFITDPSKYLQETKDLIVCPTCLAEKPMHWAVKTAISEREVDLNLSLERDRLPAQPLLTECLRTPASRPATNASPRSRRASRMARRRP